MTAVLDLALCLFTTAGILDATAFLGVQGFLVFWCRLNEIFHIFTDFLVKHQEVTFVNPAFVQHFNHIGLEPL